MCINKGSGSVLGKYMTFLKQTAPNLYYLLICTVNFVLMTQLEDHKICKTKFQLIILIYF